jgi:hypothetical protein
LNQSCYQVSVTLTGYFASKKKSCLCPDGCRHPNNFPLDLHSQLIALNLSQITLSFHKMMMHLFGLPLLHAFANPTLFAHQEKVPQLSLLQDNQKQEVLRP